MTTAIPEGFDFVLDADETYEPKKLPRGIVKMGGRDYEVRCPKDSLPMLLNRIRRDAEGENADAVDQEEIIRKLIAACFDPQDTEDIVERIVSPYDHQLSVAFLVDTVKRVYEKYESVMDEQYEELGIQNPLKQPQDHKKPAARKTTSRKPAAKKAAPRRAAARG